MNYTSNYQLHQWEASDRVARADFNADNQKLDAALAAIAASALGGAQLAVGSYTGTGTAGASNPNSLTFSFTPRLVLIASDMSSGYFGILTRGATDVAAFCYAINGFYLAGLTVSWTNNGVTWYSGDKISQANWEGCKYYYAALG